jgi:predicted acylesterase/phospholipase RssA
VRNGDGKDVELSGLLNGHRQRVLDVLRPHLDGSDRHLWGAVRELPALVAATREQRQRVLQNTPLDRDSLEAEVTERQLVVASGGGGGSGYGYAGAFRLLHREGLQPALLAGTSIGALMSMFRARHRVFDGAHLVEAGRRLSWNTVFRVLQMESRYGIPATLRLYLRAALESLFLAEGERRGLTFAELPIPLLIVATGITVGGLKHDLTFYEHFLDDAVQPGVVSRFPPVKRAARMAGIIREFVSEPEALREVVFGGDPLTRQADVLDAAGFSSAVPGIIHYDVLRDDQRMKQLLDRLYAEYGITRLTEGGLVNNLPCRPAYAEVMKGRLTRRNPFVLAMDCFSPQPSSLIFYPIQQVVRPNVNDNLRFAHLYFELDRRLSPMNLVPDVSSLTTAMQWTSEELAPHIPFIRAMCAPIKVLAEA